MLALSALKERTVSFIHYLKPKIVISDMGLSKDEMLYLFDRAINAGRRFCEIQDHVGLFIGVEDLYLKPVSYDPMIDRCYHDFSHIANGAQLLKDVEKSTVLSVSSVDDVFLAWVYHDCFYQTNPKVRAGDNEQKSAAKAFEDLVKAGMNGSRAGRIYDLVIYTNHLENPPEYDLQANLICDIDLAGMGSSPEQFVETTKLVRKEFSFASDEEWVRGRLKFWKDFLALKGTKIFRTDVFQHLNTLALSNIHSEIHCLERSLVSKGAK
jgi:predicted metal-dependent HD superfamily phosphohydrolase